MFRDIKKKRFWHRHVLPLMSGNNVLPDAVIAGVMKGGTTSLYNYMIQHPQIVSPLRKEIHYFDFFYKRGIRWYKGQFCNKKVINEREQRSGLKQITFEASAEYLYHPWAPERMHSVMPSAKAIVILRNPVTRAFSHYHHEVRQKNEKLSFSDAIEKEHERLFGEKEKILNDPRYYSFNYFHYSYQEKGRYADQINNWLRYFPMEQVLFIRSEDLFADPEHQTGRVFRFLGLEPCETIKYKQHHIGGYKDKIPAALYDKMRDAFETDNARLRGLLGDDFKWED